VKYGVFFVKELKLVISNPKLNECERILVMLVLGIVEIW
jgi:hypothetical protein